VKLRRGILAFFAVLASAQAQEGTVVTLSGAQVRITARQVGGRLIEQYQARDGGNWVTIASSAGESAGPVTARGPSGEVLAGASSGISLEQGVLTERIAIGPHEVVRNIALIGDGHWVHVTTRLEPRGQVELHSFADNFQFEERADWSFSPSIGGFNPDAQYKAPLILTQKSGRAFGIVPDVTSLNRELIRRCNHSLDLDAPGGRFAVGFIPARTYFHSVFVHDLDRAWISGQPFVNSYYILLTAAAPPGEAFREAVRLHWEKFGRRELATAAQQQRGTDAAYKALGLWDDWRSQVWEKESREQWLRIDLGDGKNGGAVRTVRWGRPSPSVYMSSWFNSVRTAVGMAMYARRREARDLLDLATGTIRVALAAPGRDGAFKCIALPKDGSVAWAAGDGAGNSVKTGYLGFDMSWTAYWLLKWRAAGLPESDGILPRCRRLADFLLARQFKDGMIPTRFDESGATQHELSRMLMAETGPAALFLLELYSADQNPRYLEAGLQALRFLEREVIPQRKWYDYETFFSCSPRAVSLDERTQQWPANNLALIPAVEAFLAAYRATGKTEFLRTGEALLDYLLLYQQSWTNPALENLSGDSMLLGGFTTQNSDAEWSDARQSQAGSVLLDYYRATSKVEYLERGVSALRSQFPISPSENWAHSGYGRKAGVSSFHWGTGSGMAGIEIEENFLRDVFIDVPSARAIGVNGIDAARCDVAAGRIELTLTSPFDWARSPVAVFRGAAPGRQYRVVVNGADVGSFEEKSLAAGITIPVPVWSRWHDYLHRRARRQGCRRCRPVARSTVLGNLLPRAVGPDRTGGVQIEDPQNLRVELQRHRGILVLRPERLFQDGPLSGQ
jgi:hypothetical protein